MLLTLGLPLGLFFFLLLPIIETCFLYLLSRYNVITRRPKFYIILNFIILCTITFYIEITIMRFFASTLNYKYYAIYYLFINPIKSLLYHFNSLSPFLTGMLATLSLSFFWTIFLWRIALTHLFKLRPRTTLEVIICLIVLNMIIGGIFGFIPHAISKCQSLL